MTLTEYAKFRVADTLRSWLGTWPASEWPHIFGGGRPSATGVPVSEETAMNYSAVWAAVSIIAGDTASLPLVLYKRTSNGGKERYLDSRLYELLHDAPNPDMTSMVFRETLTAHILSWGNGYAEIERDKLERPVALWPITPDRVTPLWENGALRYRVNNANGGQVRLSPRQMLHVPGLGFNGILGYSVIQHARESIGLGLATERFGGTFFGNGSTFGGVLSFPPEIKATQEFKQGVRESVDALHTGVDRAHKFLILGGGGKFEKFGIPPNDAQFLETRKFQVTEIARWFQIPPHKIADLERATFSNIEEQDIEYYRSCLRRWLVRWEQELNRKLISPLERKQQFFKHNAEGILRGHSAARAAFYTSMFNIGAYSINMILESEDLNPIGPEGNVHFVQGNLMPAEKAMEWPQKPPAVEVEEVPQKQLPAGKDDEDDEDDERVMTMLAEIATKTAAIEAGFQAQRDAITQAELEEHRAEVAQLTEERTALQLMFDEYRERHTNDANALHAQLETARTSAEAERVIRDTAERALVEARTAAEHRATAEAEARTAAETAVAEAKTAELDRLTKVVAAHRALIVDVMQRVLRPEVDRARRRQATPDSLQRWADGFYQTHRDVCAESLYPAVLTHLAWKRSDEDPHTVARTLADTHCAESEKQLRAVVDGSTPESFHADLERLLARWEQERPNTMADQVLENEITYIRNYR